MDKSFMNNDKKIEINQNVNFHRLIEDMPALPREYGLWVIDGTENFVEKLIDIDQCKDRRFEFYSLSQTKFQLSLWIQITIFFFFEEQ